MKDIELRIKEEIETVSGGWMHLFLLGAGASRAAFPQGDKNGKKLPLMFDLISTLGLEPKLDELGIEHEGRNFEAVYAEMASIRSLQNELSQIDSEVNSYFNSLSLPDHPTIYDHLLLSLRSKDVVATFNWDPFILQAYRRLIDFGVNSLPHLIFLHGNTGMGYCSRGHKMTIGYQGGLCSVCKRALLDSPILFPVTQKGYNNDPVIKTMWDYFRTALGKAYMFTIFGYSAPKSDVEAVGLMRGAWGSSDDRNTEEVEIIDIKSEDELYETWSPFIHTHHYQVASSFYSSYLSRHPRRSGEALWSALMECKLVCDRPLPSGLDFPELLKWFQPMLDVEERYSVYE